MSRSGYSDDCQQWDLIRWRGAVASAIRGQRGQSLLRELLAALDAMPQKRLIAEELEQGGEVCALGCLGQARGIDMAGINPEDSATVAKTFNIAAALAKEIAFENDDDVFYNRNETPEERWARMRKWVAAQIV